MDQKTQLWSRSNLIMFFPDFLCSQLSACVCVVMAVSVCVSLCVHKYITDVKQQTQNTKPGTL